MKDIYDRMIDGMFNSDVQSLCHLLLLKRSVDGLNGREWDAHKHLDYERSIQETLKKRNVSDHRTVDKGCSGEGLVGGREHLEHHESCWHCRPPQNSAEPEDKGGQ